MADRDFLVNFYKSVVLIKKESQHQCFFQNLLKFQDLFSRDSLQNEEILRKTIFVKIYPKVSL